MDYDSSHLASLRQEITHLRNVNVLYSHQSVHSAVEQTASEVRASRLVQIKQELSQLRDCPPEPRVWWDKVRKQKRAA
jgi:hypothetical protein